MTLFLLYFLYSSQDSETKFTIMDFVSMTHVRKKLIGNAQAMKTIREEEQLTLPAVKTLVDREYAEAKRKKLRQRRFDQRFRLTAFYGHTLLNLVKMVHFQDIFIQFLFFIFSR